MPSIHLTIKCGTVDVFSRPVKNGTTQTISCLIIQMTLPKHVISTIQKMSSVVPSNYQV